MQALYHMGVNKGTQLELPADQSNTTKVLTKATKGKNLGATISCS